MVIEWPLWGCAELPQRPVWRWLRWRIARGARIDRLLGFSRTAVGDIPYGETFDRLFQQHEAQIYGYLYRMTSDRQLASDLCQETFLRAWQHVERLVTYQDPLGWLFRVATNLALNALRGRLRWRRVMAPLRTEDELPGDDPTAGIGEAALVHQILQDLSPRARAGLVLREVYGLPLDEIATTLGMTPVATKKMLSRAREQFRERYRHEDQLGGSPQ